MRSIRRGPARPPGSRRPSASGAACRRSPRRPRRGTAGRWDRPRRPGPPGLPRDSPEEDRDDDEQPEPGPCSTRHVAFLSAIRLRAAHDRGVDIRRRDKGRQMPGVVVHALRSREVRLGRIRVGVNRDPGKIRDHPRGAPNGRRCSPSTSVARLHRGAGPAALGGPGMPADQSVGGSSAALRPLSASRSS